MRSPAELRAGAPAAPPRPFAAPEPEGDAGLLDLRFRALLPAAAWAELAPDVRRRFSHRPSGGTAAVYVGAVVEARASRAGRLLAWAARLIGGPLPRVWSAPTACTVMVSEDGVGGGQVWTRVYARPRGFSQTICSAKRFAGPTGLEEHVGGGVGMALTVAVEAGVLTFRSDHYFVDGFSGRLRLPRWAEPGRLTVTHVERGGGRFDFTLDLDHPALGRLIRQRAEFQERTP